MYITEYERAVRLVRKAFNREERTLKLLHCPRNRKGVSSPFTVFLWEGWGQVCVERIQNAVSRETCPAFLIAEFLRGCENNVSATVF